MGLTWAQEARVSLNLIIIRDIASRERGRDEAFANHRRRALSRKHAGAGQEKVYAFSHVASSFAIYSLYNRIKTRAFQRQTCTTSFLSKDTKPTPNMARVLALIIATLFALFAASIPAASAARLCTLNQANANSNNLKIKTMQGKVLEQFDESNTPAMQGNSCVELWCRNQCQQNEKCRGFAYLAISEGKTTCTLYSNAKRGSAQCINGKCTSEFGVCKGRW